MTESTDMDETPEKLIEQRDAYAAIIREFMAEADRFAERRRGHLNFLRLADSIEERHPEFATGEFTEE